MSAYTIREFLVTESTLTDSDELERTTGRSRHAWSQKPVQLERPISNARRTPKIYTQVI